jgi:hypothetical protein
MTPTRLHRFDVTGRKPMSGFQAIADRVEIEALRALAVADVNLLGGRLASNAALRWQPPGPTSGRAGL